MRSFEGIASQTETSIFSGCPSIANYSQYAKLLLPSWHTILVQICSSIQPSTSQQPPQKCPPSPGSSYILSLLPILFYILTPHLAAQYMLLPIQNSVQIVQTAISQNTASVTLPPCNRCTEEDTDPLPQLYLPLVPVQDWYFIQRRRRNGAPW